MKIVTATLFACAFLTGCDLVHNERLTGDYHLTAVDVMEQMAVSRNLHDGLFVGRIDETVFSVGWNDHYIVAKQHPGNDRSVTHYYYLDISRDSPHADPSESVTGPLTEAEFKKRQVELNLPAFTRTFPKLK